MRSRRVAFAVAMVGALLAAPAQGAASPPDHVHDRTFKQVKTEYFPDDICGPRAGWTTYVTTSHTNQVSTGDTIHFSYGETGTYTTVFDDPSIPSYSSQFTDAQHLSITRGGTVNYGEEFHDFPGTITIHEHIVFHQVDGQVLIDKDELSVTGCP